MYNRSSTDGQHGEKDKRDEGISSGSVVVWGWEVRLTAGTNTLDRPKMFFCPPNQLVAAASLVEMAQQSQARGLLSEE